jgi:hypothetical protein
MCALSFCRKGVLNSKSVCESGFLRLHEEKNLLNGMQIIIRYKRIIEVINEMRPRRPYLNMLVQLDASKKLELDFLTRLESEFILDNWILLIRSARTFVCSIVLES